MGRDLEKLERRELQQRNRHMQQGDLWALRRGEIFESQKGNCVWYLQQQHLLLDMLWEFVSSSGYCPFTAWRKRKGSPFSCRAHFILWNYPGVTRGCELQRSHCSSLLTCLSPRKVGSPYPHTPDWNVDSGCCWARPESTKTLNTTAKSAFARG